MKKILALLLALVMLFSLAACDSRGARTRGDGRACCNGSPGGRARRRARCRNGHVHRFVRTRS